MAVEISLLKVWRVNGRLLPVISSYYQFRTLKCSSQRQKIVKEELESPTARLKKSFQLLNLKQDECTEQEVRQAYIKLAKKYHPDSSSNEASADQFSQVREAYKNCMSYTKNVSMTRDIYAALEQELVDLDKHLGYSASKQRRVAHRHYLSYDVGVGSISQRQRAQAQERVNQAIDSVFEKQFQKALENPDVKEIAPYQKGRKIPGGQTTNTKSLERIANEIIYDSMRQGEFDNLRGRGKPLKLDPINPVLDNVEQKINKMLSHSGFAPEWISLDKEIQVAMDRLRADIEAAWCRCGPNPMGQDQMKIWEQHLVHFKGSVKNINKKIFNLNLIVPSLGSQRSNLKLNRLLDKVMETPPIPRSSKEHKPSEAANDEEDDPLLGFFKRIKDWYRYWPWRE